MSAEAGYDLLDVLLVVTGHLERLDIHYAVGGSLASSLHGRPRSTHDADILVSLDEGRADELFGALEGEYYVPKDTARKAINAASSFGVTHRTSGARIDFFVAGDGLLDQEQLSRRQRVTTGTSSFDVTSAEMLVLRKLDWYRRGGAVSERQWRDVKGMLRVQGDRLDVVVLRALAGRLGLTELLAKAEREAEGG